MSVFSRIKKSPLLLKVIVAIVLGLVCSLFFPSWLTRVFTTIGSLFGNFIGMFVPILILGLISSGIADLGKGAGKLLLFTTIVAYTSTVLTGGFSYGVCSIAYPHIIKSGELSSAGAAQDSSLNPYFTIDIPPFIDVTTALILAFLLGIAMIHIKGRSLKSFCDDLRDVVMFTISKIIIPLLPLYIFSIFLKMGQGGMAGQGMALLGKIVLLIFLMHITVLLLQFIIAGLLTGHKPLKSLLTMLPAYATALGTSSSAATIPVTLAQAKKLGIRAEIADFTIPLCATIHMPCSILKIVACAYALMLSMGITVVPGTMVEFILLAAITMVAAPGVPGGSIMAALGPLSSVLGFTPDMQAIMIALYVAMDSFGTAGNVTGDGAISLLADRFFNKKPKTPQRESSNFSDSNQ